MSEASSNRDDADVTESALDLICRGVPEHAETIRRMFLDIPIRVRLTPDIEFQAGSPVNVSPSAVYRDNPVAAADVHTYVATCPWRVGNHARLWVRDLNCVSV